VKHPVQVPPCESGFVTVTFTEPAAWADVVPVMLVASTVETVSADPPNDTLAPAWNPVPFTVTALPPAAGPLFGVTEPTVGPATYVKQPLHVPLCESGFVTVTFTAPAACAVVVPVILVALIVEMVSVDPPSETVAPVWKSAPVIVTAVPPRVEPVVGLIDVTVGAATYVKHPEHAPFCVSGFVTVTFTAPAACAAVVPVIVVALIVATVSAEPPNEAVAPAWNPVPLMDTEVPPVAGPLFGVTAETVGVAT
jgi:hypothetical protein